MKRKALPLIIVIVFAVLTVVCALMIPMTNVNYNMVKYLPEESIARQGYDLYKEEFGGTDTANVMVYLTQEQTADSFTAAFEKIRAENPDILTQVLLQGQKKDTALYVFTFSASGTDAGVQAVLDDIRSAAGEDAAVCGSVIDDEASSQYMFTSALLATVILIPVVIVLIIVSTRSLLSVVFVLASLGVAIVLNMGTNFLLGEVSFITQSIAMALQLAITLDYSIFLIHEYERQIQAGAQPGEAIRRAIARSFRSVSAAALTTLSGFIALLFMRFRIGSDLGWVFIKGVSISFLCVLLLLPALLLLFRKGVQRSTHKSWIPSFDKPARGVFRAKYVFSFLILLLIPALLLQNRIDYRFGASGIMTGEGVPSYEAKQEITAIYGNENQVLVIYPGSAPEAELALTEELSALKLEDGSTMFTSVLTDAATKAGIIDMLENEVKTQLGALLPALADADFEIPYADTYEELLSNFRQAVIDLCTGIGLPESMVSGLIDNYLQGAQEQLAQLEAGYATIDANFRSESHTRIVLTADTTEEGDEAFFMYETLMSKLDEYEALNGYKMLGETPFAYDIREYMLVDYNRASLLSAVLVFAIILISFRSLTLPFLLMIPIFTGVYINSAIPALTGAPIALIGILVVSMVHLGATIDYAILYANTYCFYRKTMRKPQAFVKALSESIPSILISAIALTVAGFALGGTANLPATADIGMMIGRAGLLSAFFTIFVLPGILYLFDGVIRRTTLHCNFLSDDHVCEITLQNPPSHLDP